MHCYHKNQTQVFSSATQVQAKRSFLVSLELNIGNLSPYFIVVNDGYTLYSKNKNIMMLVLDIYTTVFGGVR